MVTRRNTNSYDNDCRGGTAPGGIVVSSVSFHGSMAVTVVAGADAIGEHTLASVDTTIRVVDRGLLSYAAGMSGALAAALSASDAAFATSYAQLGISGADYTVANTRRIEGAAADGSSAVSGTYLDFFALDLKWLDFTAASGGETSGAAVGVPNLSGNLATFTASIEASGENSFTDLAADTLALEDQLSSVAMSATAAVDDVASYLHYVGSARNDVIWTGNDNALVEGGRGDDRVTGGSGDDWLFGGDGRDQINAGAGADTVFGDVGDDSLKGGAGDDWLLGGRGDDTMDGGDGDDLLFGSAGRDTMDGGAGADLIDAGVGRDTVRGGGGNDIFRLGAEYGDGDDRYWGGSGADLYYITGGFDSDMVMDFTLGAGDRLLVSTGNWESEDSLRQLNGSAVTLQRASGDADDLLLTFNVGGQRSQLILDEFFALNQGYAGLPMRGAFSDTAALPLLQALFGDDSGALTEDRQTLFQLGSYLSELG